MFATLSLLILMAISTSGLVPVPKKPVGFVYKAGSPRATVNLDFYIDQLCPYSKQAWPHLLAVADHYGPDKLRLTTHLFPLPYHRNSYYATKSSHIINKLTSTKMTYAWITTVFNMREAFGAGVTQHLPDDRIVEMYAKVVNVTLGISQEIFMPLFNTSEDIEMETRVGWKYCCSRGVSGTPTFMVNDVVVEGDSTWTLQDWKNVIDPLL